MVRVLYTLFPAQPKRGGYQRSVAGVSNWAACIYLCLMETQNAAHYIQSLSLLPHPEGGYYKEVFRSTEEVNRIGSAEVKQACTSIYYLLEDMDFSGFHRIASDEIWYFHKGEPLIIHVIQKRWRFDKS